jgi:hypothetical protein
MEQLLFNTPISITSLNVVQKPDEQAFTKKFGQHNN